MSISPKAIFLMTCLGLLTTACDRPENIKETQAATPSPTAAQASSTIDSFFVHGTPDGLAKFKVLKGVSGVSTKYWRSKNEKLNGQVKSHWLKTTLPIKGENLDTVFRMNHFYGYDAHQNMMDNLAIVNSECKGKSHANGLIEITREHIESASTKCKKSLSKLTGKLPLYVPKKIGKIPFWMTCKTSECTMRIVKWDRIGFDIRLQNEHLNQARHIADLSHKHIDTMIAPLGQ